MKHIFVNEWGSITYRPFDANIYFLRDTGILVCRVQISWNFNQNSSIFIQENEFENVVYETRLFCLGPSVLKIIQNNSP